VGLGTLYTPRGWRTVGRYEGGPTSYSGFFLNPDSSDYRRFKQGRGW